MVDRILVPLDGTTVSECVLPHVRALAGSFDSTVVLLRVVTPDAGGGATSLGSAGARLAKAEATSYLRRTGDGFRDLGVHIETIVEQGPAAQRIVDIARQSKADLVVLSSGRFSPSAVDVGRTARDVVSAAPTSVMMVRPGGQSPEDGRTYRRVVVPVDGSKRGEWAMCLAASLARSEGAQLLLLYVLAPTDVLDEHGLDTANELRERVRNHNATVAGRYLRKMTDLLAAPDLEIVQRVTEDSNVARAIDGVAREWGADLIVVSAHGQSGHVGWNYGSKARRLIDEGAHTTLVLQDVPVRRERAEGPRWMSPRPRGSVRTNL